jgi:hypothetical protein
MHNGAAAELRAEGPSVLAACSAGAGGRTRGVLRRGPVQPGACARLNDLNQRGGYTASAGFHC